MIRSRRSFLATAALAALALACRPGDDGAGRRSGHGPPRPFLMGVSSLPVESSEAAYRDAFRLAAALGELVLIQRAPPWADFLPGATISGRTEALTRLEKELARRHRLTLFLALDATDPADRGRLAGLPDTLRGRDFADRSVREAFIAYAKYLALNFKPAYLALGVEVDLFFNRRGDGPFRTFQSLYFEAYDAVKAASAATLVFPTFQYEDMLGVLDTGEHRLPAWSLLSRFEPKIDALAVSSFPDFAFSSVSALPADYYAALRGRLQKPLLFASTGWSSAVRPQDTGGEGEGEQAAYLELTLAAAAALAAQVVVWFLGRDPGSPPVAGFDPLALTGLYRADGQPKHALQAWQSYLEREPPR